MPHISPVKSPLAALFLSPFLAVPCNASAETLATPRISCEIAETAESTTLTAKAKGCGETAVFRIDWESGSEKPAGFKSSKPDRGAVTSSHRLGKTTITRTILASATADCILVHVVADQPGAVSFKARFVSESPAKILDRREILLSGKQIQAHAWIIPFESDVHDDGKATIFLNGEGEALIILNLTDRPETAPISNTLTRLGRKHDPAHTPPGPHLIWEGILEERERGRAGEGEK